MVNKDHLRKGEKIQVTSSLMAGSLSGLVARTFTAPMDTIKIRLQVMPGMGFTTMVKDVLKKEGLRGFWKGNVPGSAMYVIYGGVQFSSYSFYNSALNEFGWGPQLQGLIVGALAGMTSSMISYPFDVLRTRFAADRRVMFSKLTHSIYEIWSQRGIQGFFKGCLSSMLTISLNTSIMFGTYETIRVYCDNTREQFGERQWHHTLDHSASSMGAILAKLATFPLDTARRRLMISDSRSVNRFTPKIEIYERYKGRGIIRVGWQILTYEGVFALYRGLPLALLKSIPTTAVSIWSYEACLRLLVN
ncbi:hypothetical protein ZYGR_0I05290 [Zygosaccharomyces rouxii]|uniref:Mitochondrial thiamine pyrophosphate carrier 1 n=1 Tax=Zygosaccharomyces rouxii TaxID=4956 RepID=A0A1Q2ZXL8_ZYGRO|nr:hypothetical protein ZYGR_0I05290 [Zygosaccharomyces rouxii]